MEFMVYWKNNGQHPENGLEALRFFKKELFSIINFLIQFLYTLPLFTVTSKRKFSRLKRLNTHLKSTMTEIFLILIIFCLKYHSYYLYSVHVKSMTRWAAETTSSIMQLALESQLTFVDGPIVVLRVGLVWQCMLLIFE